VDELHLVHGFQTQVYTDAFYFTSYPSEDQYPEVEKSVEEVLTLVENGTLFSEQKPKVVKKCLISGSPKQDLAEYAQNQKINEMMIGTRGKHGIEGLFSSSFAEYMVRHAPCELIIYREDKE
jgi:nucleotide-binding universal stress UspA family protein